MNALTNPSLETINSTTGFPSCYQTGGWGTSTVAWANSSNAHTGTVAENLMVSNYSSGDAKLLPTLTGYPIAMALLAFTCPAALIVGRRQPGNVQVRSRISIRCRSRGVSW